MAVYTDAIQKLYVAYFNRPADYEGLAFWEQVLTANGGNVNAVSAFFAASPEYKDQVAGKSYFQIVNQIYLNLFNRDADVQGLEFWAARLREGTFTVDQIVKVIADNASDTDAKDKTTYANKVAAATAFTAELNTSREIIGYTGDRANEAAKTWLSTVGDTASLNNAIAPSNLQATVNAVAEIGNQQDGEQFTLVKGLDTLNGTSGNDVFIGAVSTDAEVNTLSALDSVNGGTGTDTLRILTDGSAIDLPNVTAIEVIEAQSSAALDIDTTSAAGVTTLNVTRANGDIEATAANTTDINVSLRDTALITDVTTNGGKNVTVKLTDAASTTNVLTATGAVVIEKTGANATNGTTVVMGDINVTGGTTVNVTSKAGSSAGLTAGGAAAEFTQGAIDIVSSAVTTTITVKQDADADGEVGAVAKAGSVETATVKFAALAKDASVTIGGLTFTASKALTAAQVAQAFANLSAAALTPTDVEAATTADGDTQGSGVVANGVFSGSLVEGWNTGAASGDTVTFTAVEAGNMDDLTGDIAPVITQGTDAADGEAAAATVTAGAVTIDAGAALKTVTVNGYAATGSDIAGTAAALDTISLANGGAFTVADTADTLGLTLEAVDGAITFTAAPLTLNVKSVGSNTIGNLVAADTKTLNVSGTGTLSAAANTLTSLETIVVTETAGLNLGTVNQANVKSVNTTGTTGTVTVKVDGTKAVYTGGAGVDKLSIGNNAVITKAINLGAGNDTLDLRAITTFGNLNNIASTNVLQGGDGTDTLVLDVAAAASVSGGATFETRVNSFEKLELTQAAGAQTINLDNIDDINYVISNGSTAGLLKLDQMQANATVELKAAHAGGIEVALKDATGEADVVNLVTNATTGTNIGTVTVADVETININAMDATSGAAVSTNTVTLAATAATLVNVTGAGNLVLNLGTSAAVETVDGSTATGKLTVDLSAFDGVGVTVKGGAAADTLKASVGATAEADVLLGGAGDDILVAGSNGATLTGGAGNDWFLLSAAAADTGSKESNTYSTITDFAAGDLLQLGFFDGTAAATVTEFAKLTATLNPSTAVFSDYVNAAMAQASASGAEGQAVWFMIGTNSYVVVDSGDLSDGTFTNGEDLIIQLAGVNLNNASFNDTFGTIALV
jgi:hypothetical protein